MLLSAVIHLAAVGEIVRPHWWRSAAALDAHAPLDVQLIPAMAAMSFPVAAARPSRPLKSATPLTAEPVFQPPPAASEDVVSDDPAPATQDEIPDVAAPLVESPAELTDSPTARRLPASGKLVYRFYWGESRWLAGRATHQWTVDNDRYCLSSTVSTTGLFGLIHPLQLVETSQGTLVGDRLRPQMFITQLNEHPPAVGYFNWDKGYFRWYRGTAWFAEPLPASAYDKISFLYQLYLTPLNEISYSTHITMGRRLEHYDIRNLGVVEVRIDGKDYPATHLKRFTRSAEVEQIEIWLSSSDRLPLMMIYSNSAGDRFEQVIEPESISATLTQ